MEPSASLEIIQGPYDAATHKKFAPLEDAPEAAAYLRQLEKIVDYKVETKRHHRNNED